MALLVAPAALLLLQGWAHEHTYQGDSGNTVVRSFCPDCGTPLFGRTEGAQYVIVKAGSLDDPSAFRARVGLWTDSAPPWHHLDTTIPTYKRNGPG